MTKTLSPLTDVLSVHLSIILMPLPLFTPAPPPHREMPEVDDEWNTHQQVNQYEATSRGKTKQDLHNFFHQQTWWSRLLGGLIPGWGIEMALDQIIDLAYDIKKICQLDRPCFETDEQETQMMMLQNRLVLDFRLAKGGDTCSVIDPQCCTNIDDFFQDILDDTDVINKTGQDARKVPAPQSSDSHGWSFTCWLWSLYRWIPFGKY
ncbi:hypothetical protein chiPu_0020192 [Chiloscyllium punctatum]|uniref:Uncharacterized protein n=1 Tax=Chiloscyllium punctatum TaxID=137246 RepID=A0A401RUA7_CHIPU|nr:hypothetical protein [Chiloscyllium punctatum]